MLVKRTFSLDPEVDDFLRRQSNRSKTVNTILRQYLADLEQHELIEGYRQMGTTATMTEQHAWESATIADGLLES